jgi:hypothetical protein
MTAGAKITHRALVALAAAMLADCRVNWSGTPWSEDSGGEYGGHG